jgi:hypothetical protein
MKYQVAILEINAEHLIPVTKDEPTEMSVCGCKAAIQACYIRSLMKS